jgi:HK97 family phage portal protein
MVLDRGSVLHIKRGGLSGELLGRGASDQFARSLRIALTAEEWAGRYLEGGGVPPAIIQTQANIGPAKAAAFKNDWRRMLDSGEALLLPANATVTPLVSDAQRQQLIEARQWNAHLACQMVGVPTYKLGLEGPSMTYQNVEQAGIDWRIDTLDRYGQPIANAINKYLMPNGTTCRWMWAQVERTDAQTQATVTGTLYSSGVIERDEARARIGYAPAAKTIEEGGTPQGVPEPGPQEV